MYKPRSEVECTFNLLKQTRRFVNRYEKTLRNYVAFVAIGCAMLWLRLSRSSSVFSHRRADPRRSKRLADLASLSAMGKDL